MLKQILSLAYSVNFSTGDDARLQFKYIAPHVWAYLNSLDENELNSYYKKFSESLYRKEELKYQVLYDEFLENV